MICQHCHQKLIEVTHTLEFYYYRCGCVANVGRVRWKKNISIGKFAYWGFIKHTKELSWISEEPNEDKQKVQFT